MDRQSGTADPAAAAPGKSQAKLERVHSLIVQRIGDGTYRPGQRLVLDKIARELSISTVPVREALRRLEAAGYVEFELNVGARVSQIDPAEYVPTMHILALLEGYATVLAAPHISAATIAEARAMNEEMRRLADNDFDAPTFSRLNRRFHFMLYEHCPHRHLRDLIEAEWDRLDAIGRSGFAFAPQRAHVSVAEHEEILDLISARADDAELETKARLHKLHTIDAVLATHTPAGTQAHEATGGST